MYVCVCVSVCCIRIPSPFGEYVFFKLLKLYHSNDTYTLRDCLLNHPQTGACGGNAYNYYKVTQSLVVDLSRRVAADMGERHFSAGINLMFYPLAAAFNAVSECVVSLCVSAARCK